MAGVKGRSGRKSRKAILGNAMDIMVKSAPEAAQYLFDVVSGAIPSRKVSYSRIDCAKYIIDQVHGKAPSKVQVSSPDGQSLVSYTQLILLAESVNKPDNQSSIEVQSYEIPKLENKVIDRSEICTDCQLKSPPASDNGLMSSLDSTDD